MQIWIIQSKGGFTQADKNAIWIQNKATTNIVKTVLGEEKKTNFKQRSIIFNIKKQQIYDRPSCFVLTTVDITNNSITL